MAFFGLNSAAVLNLEALPAILHFSRQPYAEYGILIHGHADRSGAEDYNIDLSRRRAEAVRDYLIKNGVVPDRIRIEFFGESRPLVETVDGLPEYMNRRAEIIFEPKIIVDRVSIK